MEAEVVLKAYQEAVQVRLNEHLPSADWQPRILHEAIRYACLSPGKRLRPALCLASCEAVGGQMENALDIAAALEMVHVFSLIHDDLPAIDNDDFRRGLPTVHRLYGDAIAILAGDALFALAFQTLATCSLSAIDRVQCLEIVSRASGSNGLVGGEVEDVLTEGKEPTADAVDWIHERKTGSLIAASCVTGGIAGGATPEQLAALQRCGELTGLAFQVTDDILNETATQEQIGKSVGSDRLKQKATYPAVHGLEASRERAHRLVESAISVIQGVLPHSKSLEQLATFSVVRLR